ncbi:MULTISPECIES: hypothetical protein [Acinetobacter]|uniref:hypothetical protein n=1 Tax=Acinetobacter TaxID=469 RepID=UPI000537D9C1|nr:hypothetical protein [Acinetobacter sp. HR7]KGT48327.1 hypothetical protein GW12_05830 [Acinetobacter sp. HR7]
MVKLLLFICFLIAIYAAWIVFFKMDKARDQLQHWHKKFKSQQDAFEQANPEQRQPREILVDAYELQLFDDVAQLFFKAPVQLMDRQQAEQLQQKWLSKMPMQTNTLIRKMDLGEWSIYWNFYDQSLEYYVGRYGIFYTHVDRHGQEHKREYRLDVKQADCA